MPGGAWRTDARKQPAQGGRSQEGQDHPGRVGWPRPPWPGGEGPHAEGRGPSVPQGLPSARPGRARQDHVASQERWWPRSPSARRRHRDGGCRLGDRPQRRARGTPGRAAGPPRLRGRGCRARLTAARHPGLHRRPRHSAAAGQPHRARPAHRWRRPPGCGAPTPRVRVRRRRGRPGRRPGRRAGRPGGRAGLDHRPAQPGRDRPFGRRLRRAGRDHPRAPFGADDRGGVEDLCRCRGPRPGGPGDQPQPHPEAVRRRRVHRGGPGRRS